MVLRRTISLMVACYAFAFAIGALTAVRWPSIMMAVGWLNEGDVAGGMSDMDWRELGIAYGGPYMLAAICFYASAVMITARRHGALTWFAFGCAAGFPCVFLVDFEARWWINPSAAEGAVAGAGIGAVLLAIAVWDLRKRKPGCATTAIETSQPAIAPAPQPVPVVTQPAVPAAIISRGKRKPRMMSAAVARQRASFVREGRKMQARKRRH